MYFLKVKLSNENMITKEIIIKYKEQL